MTPSVPAAHSPVEPPGTVGGHVGGSDRDPIFSTEDLARDTGIPLLAYFRAGLADQPLVVYLGGGGGLARNFYGHPGSDERDFMDHWLAHEGYGLLAVSYPSDHPVYDTVHPDVTMQEWCEGVAAATARLIDEHGLSSRVIAVGWSMSGRAARPFNVAAGRRGITVDCFISLSSTPIGLISPVYPGDATPELSKALFWDKGDGRRQKNFEDLAIQSLRAGRQVLSEHELTSLYWQNTPLNFLGERHRIKNGQLVESNDDLLAEVTGAFDFKTYPLTCTITPLGPRDARHALTDSSAWHFINAHKIFGDWLSRPGRALDELSPDAFSQLVRTIDGLPARLTRRLEGNHFFFVGEPGARDTAHHLADLHREAIAVRGEIDGIMATLDG